MTYLLRTPTNKGNTSRSQNGNKPPTDYKKRTIHNTPESYFTSLSDINKEACCMHVIKHLRKYFKIIDCKSEWAVVHNDFATNSLTEEMIENILPLSYNKPPNNSNSSPPSKRKRCTSEYEDGSFAKLQKPKRRRTEGDSYVSSVESSEEGSVVSSSDFSQPGSPSDQLQSSVTYDSETIGDFHEDQNYEAHWYLSMNHEYYYSPISLPVYYSSLGMSQEPSDLVQYQFPSTLYN